jgi:hypothetical protein
MKPIIDKYKSDTLQIFFPYPKVYDVASSSGTGQLLMIFRAPKQIPDISSIPYTIDFTSSGNSQKFIDSGFCGAEDWGTWSCAKEESISFNFKSISELKKPLYMKLKFNSLSTVNHPQKFEFYLNGKLIGSKTCTSQETYPQIITMDISNALQNKNTLTIKVPDAATPKSLGINEDTRELGFGLITIVLKTKRKIGILPHNTRSGSFLM